MFPRLGIASEDKKPTGDTSPQSISNGLETAINAGPLLQSLDFRRKVRGRPPKFRNLVADCTNLLKAEDVVEELRTELDKRKQQYLGIGKVLIEKKAAVGHGEFMRLFKDHPSHVENPLNMCVKRAQEYMAVARDPRITRDFHNLPSSLDTLVILTRLSTAAFDAGLANGSIHENLTRSQALRLAKNHPVAAIDNGPGAEQLPADRQGGKGVTDPPGDQESVIFKKLQLAVWSLTEEFQTSQDRADLNAAVKRLVGRL